MAGEPHDRVGRTELEEEGGPGVVTWRAVAGEDPAAIGAEVGFPDPAAEMEGLTQQVARRGGEPPEAPLGVRSQKAPSVRAELKVRDQHRMRQRDNGASR